VLEIMGQENLGTFLGKEKGNGQRGRGFPRHDVEAETDSFHRQYQATGAAFWQRTWRQKKKKELRREKVKKLFGNAVNRLHGAGKQIQKKQHGVLD